MANYPDRCQHLKINGTQCGSPALRRNRFCFFHKRFQDERIRLSADRARRNTTFILPVLEDADSIQIALMQVMRLLVSGQIEHKTASLLLYALQTASTNLRMTRFAPACHEVILDPRDARQTPLESDVWEDEDFEEEEEPESDEDMKRRVMQESADRVAARAKERARKRKEAEESVRQWNEKHPDRFHRIDEDGHLISEPRPELRKPAASVTSEQVRA